MTRSPASSDASYWPLSSSAKVGAGTKKTTEPHDHSIRIRLAIALVALVLGQLLIQRRLEHCLGQLPEQPCGASQGQALLLDPPQHLLDAEQTAPAARDAGLHCLALARHR